MTVRLLPPASRPALRSALAVLLLLAGIASAGTAAARAAPAGGSAALVRHVFVIVLENEPYQVTFGAHSLAPYLARQLPRQGAMLT